MGVAQGSHWCLSGGVIGVAPGSHWCRLGDRHKCIVIDSDAHGDTMAAIAQLGERQTEDLKVPGSSPGLGTFSVCQQSEKQEYI